MAFTKTRNKIYHLRRQSEEERLGYAMTMTVIIGVPLAIISLAVLLPLKLYTLSNRRSENSTSNTTIDNVNQEQDSTTNAEANSFLQPAEVPDSFSQPQIGGTTDFDFLTAPNDLQNEDPELVSPTASPSNNIPTP